MDERISQIQAYEKRLGQLQRQYELYFQGLERLPPEGLRDELQRALRTFQARAVAAKWPTALRYRINSLLQRFTSYDQKWRREMVAIENGTARRDRLRAAQKRSAAVPVPLNLGQPSPAASQHKLAPQQVQSLYDTYLKARAQAGQKTNLSLESMTQKLNKQLPALQKKHPGKKIGFRVVVKDGQAQLRAVVK